MYLKKLSVAGFKSFADKLEVEFDRGVTGIVGPNGCGKSNISDAIRWVLGEQNPRRLRGQSMTDMIFNGTATRPAHGLSEVSLLFDNADSQLSVSYREVLITRRLYRSGESEYLLNKTKCRLKDITDLFLDSGIGTNSYSLMEQGRVDTIVNAKPAERREILEEAAGVSRFLHRRNEALRKLDRTDNDLVRIHDILSELQRQRRSLERQARQAELARKYRLELMQVEYVLHIRSGKHLIASLDEHANRLKGLNVRIETQEGRLKEIRSRKSALNERLQEQDAINRKQRDTYAASNARLEQMERHQQTLSERACEYAQMRIRLLGECEADTKRVGEENQRVADAKQHIETLTRESTSLQETIDTMTAEVEKVSHRFTEIESEGERRRKTFIDLEKVIAEIRNQQRVWDRDREFFTVRLEKAQAEREEIEKELKTLRTQQEELTRQDRDLDIQIGERRSNLEETAKKLDELKQAESETHDALSTCEREWQQARSRLESLNELQAKLAGYDEGVRFLLRGDDPHPAELVCTLAEKIRVENGCEIAMEAALANKLQAIVAENETAVIQAVRRLRDEKKGRAAFFNNNVSVNNSESSTLHESLISLKRAGSAVHCDDSLKPLVDRLLDCVLFADGLEQAIALWPHLPPGGRLVTKDGDVVDSDGCVTGGYSAGSQILSRATEIEKLDEQVQKLNTERLRLDERIQEIYTDTEVRTAEHDTLRQSLMELENRKRITKDELERTVKRLPRLEESSTALQTECDGLNKKLREGAEKAEERKQQLILREEERNRLEQELNAWSEQVQQVRNQRREMEERLSEHRLILLEKKKDVERWQADIETITRHLQELERGITEKKELAEQQDQRRIGTEKAIEETKTAVTHSRQERDDVWKEVCATEEITQGLRSELRTVENEENTVIEQYERLRTEREGAEQERMKLQVEEEYWRCKLDESFSELDNKEACERDERDDEALNDKAEFYRRRLNQLGMVNELAIEEYEEVRDRCEFLEDQYKDLQKSRADLIATAKELHGTTIDLFLETFKKVKENFNRTFRKMFNGGRAELILQDGDPMEAGIEIEVQPPGKKLQSISLLSGGEKALVATVLLFAIYEIKPCPFCFLDEIDAPLDETNIGRFTTMLRSFLDRSQFIMITHSKKTMEICDSLYGVTMAEEGVSTFYSMQFEKGRTAATAPSIEETDLMRPGLSSDEVAI